MNSKYLSTSPKPIKPELECNDSRKIIVAQMARKMLSQGDRVSNDDENVKSLLSSEVLKQLNETELAAALPYLRKMLHIEVTQRTLGLGVGLGLLGWGNHLQLKLEPPNVQITHKEDSGISLLHHGIAQGMLHKYDGTKTLLVITDCEEEMFSAGVILGLTLQGVAIPWNVFVQLLAYKESCVYALVLACSLITPTPSKRAFILSLIPGLSSPTPSLFCSMKRGYVSYKTQAAAFVALGLSSVLNNSIEASEYLIDTLYSEMLRWDGTLVNENNEEVEKDQKGKRFAAMSPDDCINIELKASMVGLAIGLILMPKQKDSKTNDFGVTQKLLKVVIGGVDTVNCVVTKPQKSQGLIEANKLEVSFPGDNYSLRSEAKRLLLSKDVVKTQISSKIDRTCAEGTLFDRDTRAAGALLAIGLINFDTGDGTLLSELSSPETERDVLLSLSSSTLPFLSFARGLISFSSIKASKECLLFLTGGSVFKSQKSYVCESYVALLTGALSVLGIRYSGTCDGVCRELLMEIISYFMPGIYRQQTEHPHHPPPTDISFLLPESVRAMFNNIVASFTLRQHHVLVATAILSLSLVMSGTCDPVVLRLIGGASSCLECGLVLPESVLGAIGRPELAECTRHSAFGGGYGFHLKLSVAAGVLCMGHGKKHVDCSSLRNIGIMVCSCAPFNIPLTPTDETSWLQMLFHTLCLASKDNN